MKINVHKGCHTLLWTIGFRLQLASLASRFFLGRGAAVANTLETTRYYPIKRS